MRALTACDTTFNGLEYSIHSDRNDKMIVHTTLDVTALVSDVINLHFLFLIAKVKCSEHQSLDGWYPSISHARQCENQGAIRGISLRTRYDHLTLYIGVVSERKDRSSIITVRMRNEMTVASDIVSYYQQSISENDDTK
ncbi:hypothetical protein E2C01_062551 [Portunus trituberculatus]|uniref:Uncharacterized protein n=1 Tax=Portunus trituberculatus TaxID=210409 RepID=A0A5B7H6P5_PORTR|nr:hypothetical protein [Portunus trituberculatus]